MLRIVAGVVRADEGGVVARAVEDVAEIVTDEGVGPNGSGRAIGSIELRIPRVPAQPDVVADRIEVGIVELDAGVDAVVARSIWRQASRVIGVAAVERQPGRQCLLSPRRRARKTTVV